MLNSEFSAEMATLLRSLQQRVRTEPAARQDAPIVNIERAIIALVQEWLRLKELDR
jgi:hypothetical protein